MSNLKYGARCCVCLDGRWVVVCGLGQSVWITGCHDWVSIRTFAVGVYTTKEEAARVYEETCNRPPPTYTAPHVEVKPDPWPSMMAKVTDAMSRLCDAAEQMKKERDEAIAELAAARAEVARLKEERK